MTPWDEPGGTWDNGNWDSDLTSSNQTPKKHKKMKHNSYYPTRIGDRIVWLANLKTKLPGKAALLGLDAVALAAILLDIDNVLFALEKYRGALESFADSGYQLIENILHSDLATTIAWETFTLPAGAPAAVQYGALKRIFTYIADVIKAAPAYDSEIGQALGTEGSEKGAPDAATTVPDFSLRPTTGGKLEVVWTRGVFDGIKLEFDLGTAGMKTDVDIRPNYTLAWLPPTGTAVSIKVRLAYLYKGEEFGLWSDWKSWTLSHV